ncbi:hypothetical protein [Shewanella donghaensis]|uniref:hypothetical protein n=1 Tax=Shewanella donghaensis TaxID=238836 RepID=UPI0011840C5A|nr:hypothetical protein [Shewanella donghaensis]
MNRCKVIIHVGPGKCGSFSLQKIFLDASRSRHLGYIKVAPNTIKAMESNSLETGEVDELFDAIKKLVNSFPLVIISHEFFFQNLNAIVKLATNVKQFARSVTVVGFCRPQSAFLASAYSQWIFRDKTRLIEIDDILRKACFNPILFSGVERYYIAAVLTGFDSARQRSGRNILDWYKHYSQLAIMLKPLNIKVKVEQLLSGGTNVTLAKNFCRLSDLNADYFTKYATSLNVINPAYNEHLVEVIANGNRLGLDMIPNEHYNDRLLSFSNLQNIAPCFNSKVLDKLKLYVSWYFEDSNTRLADEFQFDFNFPEGKYINGSVFAKDKECELNLILKFLRSEQELRLIDIESILLYHQQISSLLLKAVI